MRVEVGVGGEKKVASPPCADMRERGRESPILSLLVPALMDGCAISRTQDTSVMVFFSTRVKLYS